MKARPYYQAKEALKPLDFVRSDIVVGAMRLLDGVCNGECSASGRSILDVIVRQNFITLYSTTAVRGAGIV